MTVDVDVTPEVRGELDAAKFSRLLQVKRPTHGNRAVTHPPPFGPPSLPCLRPRQLLPVVTGKFARVNCLAAVAAADRAVYPPLLARVPVRLPNPSTLTQGEEDDEDVDATAAAVTGDQFDIRRANGGRHPHAPEAV